MSTTDKTHAAVTRVPVPDSGFEDSEHDEGPGAFLEKREPAARTFERFS